MHTTSSPDHVKRQSPLHSTDRLLIAFWSLLSLLTLALHSRIPFWWAIIGANAAAAALVWAVARAAKSTGLKILLWVHDWAAFPLVLFTYKQLYYLIGPIHHGKDYDQLLIAIDQTLFRVNPTEWLVRFSTPFVTEVLQIAYSLFYVFFLAVGLELYRQSDLSRFRYFSFTVVYGFFLSYAAYFFLPSAGPRFTLHDFSRMDTDLPGLLCTPALRWFINIWESIPPGVSNSVALASAQRDVFPSGHTMMTLVVIAFACKYRLKTSGFVLVVGILLIAATVYLRYHYAVDVLAGAFLTILCLLTSERTHSWFEKVWSLKF